MTPMGKGLIAFCVLALAAGSRTAAAEDHAIATRIGFLGFGLEYTYTVSELIAVRAGINGADYGFDATESGIDYDFEFVWDSLAAGVDIHPTRKPLRLSFGILSNDNGFDARGRVVGGVDIGGTTYTPEEVGSLRANVGFDSTSPYAGIGWDWSRNAKRVGVSFDLGVVSQGGPKVRLSGDGSLLGDPSFAADLAAESAELEAEFSDLDLFT
jgi:hypothetical protein